jgi:hypothetical protein
MSTITLDQATRARVVKELGLAGGLDAIPAEITIVAVDPKAAGYKEPEVAGFAAGLTRGVFVNRTLTPALNEAKLQQQGAKGFVLSIPA